MLKIYHMPGGSRSARIVWAAEELQTPYELIIKERRELKLPDFLAINPFGTAPAIEDDGVSMHESCAILAYLVDRYDLEGRISPPVSSPARAAYQQWMHFPEASFWPHIASYLTASGLFAGAPDDAAKATAKERVANTLNYIDNTLREQAYIAGDAFTAADIALGWTLMIARRIGAFDAGPHKNVANYIARLEERPGRRRAMEVPAGYNNQPPGSIPTPPIVLAT